MRAFLGEQRLLGGGGLVDLRAGGGVPLGRVGEGLLGRVVGAGQVEHLAAEALDDSAGVGLGVGQRGAAFRLAELRDALQTARPIAATTTMMRTSKTPFMATSVLTGKRRFGPAN